MNDAFTVNNTLLGLTLLSVVAIFINVINSLMLHKTASLGWMSECKPVLQSNFSEPIYYLSNDLDAIKWQSCTWGHLSAVRLPQADSPTMLLTISLCASYDDVILHQLLSEASITSASMA